MNVGRCNHLSELQLPREVLLQLYDIFDMDGREDPRVTLNEAKKIVPQAFSERAIVAYALESAIFCRRNLRKMVDVQGLVSDLPSGFIRECCLSSWYRHEFTWLKKDQIVSDVPQYLENFVLASHRGLAERELQFEKDFRLDDKPFSGGGLGFAYLAQQIEPDRLVVIKFPRHWHDERVRNQFRREADMLAKAEHPNIVNVWETGDRGWAYPEPYIAMEFCAGKELRAGEFEKDFPGAAACIEQLAAGLTAIHRFRIGHGDIKPGNCLRKMPKDSNCATYALCDFGFAREMEADQYTPGSRSLGKSIKLTPGFAAPEQQDGILIDATDIYALGATFFALIEGQPPIERNSHGDVLFHKKWPWPLKEIVRKAVQLEPLQRYERASELHDDLVRWLDRRPTSAETKVWWRWSSVMLRRYAFQILFLIAIIVAVAIYWDQSNRRQLVQMNQAARLLDEGVQACRQGDTAVGILTVAASLNELGPKQQDLAVSARRVLASELRSVHPLMAVLDGFSGMVLAASIHPDGSMLATGDDKGDVRCFALPGFQERWRVRIGEQFDDLAINVVAWNSDGTQLLVGTGKNLAVLDVETSAKLRLKWAHEGQIRSAWFMDAAGKSVCVGGYSDGRDSECTVYELGTEGPVKRTAKQFGKARAIAVSVDGKWIAAGGEDRQVRVLDANSSQPITLAPMPHPGPLFALAFNPQNTVLATGCLDGKIRMFELPSGRRLGESLVHRGPIRSLAFSADGRQLLSGSEDGTAQLWDVSEPVQYRRLGPALYHLADVRCVSFDPRGQYLVTAGMDQSVRIWMRASNNGLQAELQHPASISSARFGPDQTTILTTCLDSESQLGAARLWSIDGTLLKEFGHGGEVLAAAIRPRKHTELIAVGGSDVKHWSTNRPDKLLQSWPLSRMASVAFSPDGRRFVVAGRTQSLYVCDDVDQFTNPLRKVELMAGGLISQLQFSPDGKFFVSDGGYFEKPDASAAGGKLKLAMARLCEASDLGGGKTVELEHDQEVRGVLFSHDSRHIVTLSFEGDAKLWDAAIRPNPLQYVLSGDGGRVSAAAFSHDDQRVAIGGASRTLRIWNVSSGRLEHAISHSAWIRAISFHPDGNMLAVAGDDGAIQLWDPLSAIPMGTALPHAGVVTSLEFSADGKLLLSAGADGVAKLWSIPNPSVGSAAEVTNRARRMLGISRREDGSLIMLNGEAWRRYGE